MSDYQNREELKLPFGSIWFDPLFDLTIKGKCGAGEKACWLRAYTAAAEDSNMVTSSTPALQTQLPLLASVGICTQVHILHTDTCIHVIKKIFM